MFVIPPPQKFPIGTATSPTSAPLAPVPVAELANTIAQPAGPEYQLSVGEGTYTLRDDILLAIPTPHPQDNSTHSTNPLATTPSPPRVGVKLSICILAPRSVFPHVLANSSMTNGSFANLGTYSIKEHEKESRSSHDTSSEGHNSQHMNGIGLPRVPVFGENNHLLSTSQVKDNVKRKKPKTNLTKSNSQFISRVVPHDSLSKRLQEHSPEGMYVFANVDRAFQWLDLSSPILTRAQPLLKILFTKSHVLCHDVNHLTKSSSHLDVIMGSNTGDIIWFEAFSQKYGRINKGNVISTSPVSDIQWLPGSESLFLAAHMDGTLTVYDKEREDAAFHPEGPNHGTPSPETGQNEFHHSPESNTPPLYIHKSVNSKNQKTNPVASWQMSNHSITALAFSSDCCHLAVVSEDGSLRIIDYLKEQLTDLYPSYYGAFTCVCWSPDGRYILTGGQDDLVSIWSLYERRIIARCAGHHSWVTAVSFDPWRCDGRNYRFGSVGEDRRLLLWDFNIGMLRRPKAASIRHRASVASHLPSGRPRTQSAATNRFRSTSSLPLPLQEPSGQGLMEHEVESRMTTAELPPVMSKVVDDHRMSWVGFEEESIITACSEGHVRVWARPQEGAANGSQIALS